MRRDNYRGSPYSFILMLTQETRQKEIIMRHNYYLLTLYYYETCYNDRF